MNKKVGANGPSRCIRFGLVRCSLMSGIVALSVLASACSSSTTPTPSGPAGTGVTVAPRSSASGSTAPTTDRGGTLRLGVGPFNGAPALESLDPADVIVTNQAGLIATDLLFDGLMELDPATNEAAPSLAVSASSNPEITVWTFPLRPDAAFSDGTPVTAADVKFSLERLALKDTASLPGARLEIIAGYAEFVKGGPDFAGVQAVDQHTVQITTRVPYAALPELLSSPLYGVVSKAAVTALKAEYGQKPVGSGPFTFVSADDKVVTLARAKDSQALLEGAQLFKFADRAEPMAALKAGKVDWAAVPTGDSIESVKNLGMVKSGQQSIERFFAFNLGGPITGEGRDKFRQAIVKSVDRKKIATTILSSQQPMNGVVLPSLPGGSPDACGEACAFDVEAAKKLVAEAFPAGDVPTIEVDSYTGASADDQAQAAAAAAIVADLKAAGIPVLSVAQPFEEFRLIGSNPSRQLFSFGWLALAPDPDLYLSPLFLSDSPDNTIGFKNPAVDAAIATARATPDRKERLKQYAAIEKQVMALVPLLPLAVLDTSVIVARSVDGYESRFDGTFLAETLSIKA